MSGGVAYVLDRDGRFETRCNMGLVGFDEITESDAIELHELIEEHHLRTRSAVAARILREWDATLPLFKKVMPHDYKRALAEMAEEEASSRGSTGAGRLMGKQGAFLEITRVEAPERDPRARTADYKEFVDTLPVEGLRDQGARCMECGVPFCHNGCPLGNLIPDWNDLVYRDRWREAIDQLHATNNFPEFTGRLCPAPCEAACVLEIREGDAVSIKQIEVAIVNRAFDEGWIVPRPPSHRDGPHGRRGRRRAGGARRRPAAAPRGPRRDGLRARRGRRRADPLRRAGLQDREVGDRAPARAARRRGRRVPLRRRRRASTSIRRSCARSTTRS